MYDYISIHSDDYTKQIKSEVLEYFIHNLGFTKVSHLKFTKRNQWRDCRNNRYSC